MLNAILIEDEKAAMAELAYMLSETSAEVNIVKELHSIKESLAYLEDSQEADLIFADVQLGDGLSFEIFKQTGVKTPVVFTTGYDEFVMMAFENNGIDYLLKPVSKSDLDKAISKFQRLKTHFAGNSMAVPIDNLTKFIDSRKKNRLLVKRGMENIALRLEDITLLYTENKVVYVLDKCCKKYMADKTLTELEQELDPQQFFRANRQYIVNIDYIKCFKPFEKVKLSVDLSIPEINHNITISQENAPAFRKWMCEA